MEALNGRYGVSKRRDGAQGSLFWFAIPYRPDHTAAQLMDQIISEVTSSSKSSKIITKEIEVVSEEP